MQCVVYPLLPKLAQVLITLVILLFHQVIQSMRVYFYSDELEKLHKQVQKMKKIATINFHLSSFPPGPIFKGKTFQA